MASSPGAGRGACGWTDFEIKTASHDLSTATVNLDAGLAAAAVENKLNLRTVAAAA